MNWIDPGIVGYIAFGCYRWAIEHMVGGFIMAIALLIWTWQANYISERTTGEHV